MRALLVPILLAAVGLARAATPHPALLSDLTDDVLAKLAPQAASSSPAATLDAVLRASEAYVFKAHGITVYSDRRWFDASSVEGEGAPAMELRRWPGDTILAFYDLDPAGASGTGLPAGLKLGAKRGDLSAWSCTDARLEASRGDFDAVWCENASVEGRRLGALGVPGDAGLGEGASSDLRDAILALLRGTKVEPGAEAAKAPPKLPELPEPPRQADEKHHAWGAFAGTGYTLGLPPGLRAIRLDAGVPPPRPMPQAVAWIRGRFTDREGKAVAVGDATRAGYVAILGEPSEAWRAGVAPPLGAPSAERMDEAPLDDTVREWTGASRAVVSHWKEDRYDGDWLVFRLAVKTKGVEIGLPVETGWRSPALFWIPVTYRGEGRPPAPPPIDPAESLGVHFARLGAAEQKTNGLVEGYLTVADLKIDVPRGWWPIANLSARDGLPVTFVDGAGGVIGEIARRPAGSPELAPRTEDGWVVAPKPAAQHAAAIFSLENGSAVLVAKAGHGYLFLPREDSPARRDGWRRLRESAAFIKAPKK
ncbi:MAG TPA: hypothetical protein VFV19_14160 [Candidatus Polarisedimenticolaceae bacterium]|nr:hypothetical protein [Candidatus Polarisedimenticolaceae bacterium]